MSAVLARGTTVCSSELDDGAKYDVHWGEDEVCDGDSETSALASPSPRAVPVPSRLMIVAERPRPGVPGEGEAVLVSSKKE
jgi:hypothetical protein